MAANILSVEMPLWKSFKLLFRSCLLQKFLHKTICGMSANETALDPSKSQFVKEKSL